MYVSLHYCEGWMSFVCGSDTNFILQGKQKDLPGVLVNTTTSVNHNEYRHATVSEQKPACILFFCISSWTVLIA
jgi:hypothetical protein